MQDMVLVGILNDMGKGSTGVVVPLMAIARQRPAVPFPVCFWNIFLPCSGALALCDGFLHLLE